MHLSVIHLLHIDNQKTIIHSAMSLFWTSREIPALVQNPSPRHWTNLFELKWTIAPPRLRSLQHSSLQLSLLSHSDTALRGASALMGREMKGKLRPWLIGMGMGRCLFPRTFGEKFERVLERWRPSFCVAKVSYSIVYDPRELELEP